MAFQESLNASHGTRRITQWTSQYSTLPHIEKCGTNRGEIRGIKTLNLWRNIVSLQVLGRCFVFFTLRDHLVAQQFFFFSCVIILSRNKYFCCGLKEKARVYLEQQILALLLVCYQTHNCHATNMLMLCDKLKDFVPRISPP